MTGTAPRLACRSASRRPIPQSAPGAARAAFVVEMTYAAISVYWGTGRKLAAGHGRRHPGAAGLSGVLTVVGLLVQGRVIASGAHADERALAWPAYLWDPWFLGGGLLVLVVLVTTRPTVRGVT